MKTNSTQSESRALPVAAHTPEPWHVGSPIRSSDTIGICHSYPDDPEGLEETIAEVLPGGLPGNQEADAHLIAAAPELLACCEQALQDAEGDLDAASGDDATRYLTARCDTLRAVIAKAKGQA